MRTNGYAAGNDINGMFSMTAQVSNDVAYVEFYLDDALQTNDTSAPFTWDFDTNNYPLGQHNITVIAYDSNGQNASAVWQRNFVEMPTGFYIIIILVVVFAVIVSVVSVINRSKLTKCPHCGHIFQRKYSWIHFGSIGRNKCPNCGKAFWTKAYKGPKPKDDEKSAQSDSMSNDERLRKDIDNSKYES